MSTQQYKTQTLKQNTNNNYLNNNNNLTTKYLNKIQKKIERNISHKVVIIGDSNVGKTCLITRFNHNKFDTTAPTIGAIHHIKTAENISLDIWDTAGQERFKSMIPMYYKGASAIIICFDITNQDSFEGAQNWHTEIFESVKKVIIVLCGTKRDLEQKRQVDYSISKKFGDKNGIKYFETSAKDNFNVQEIFNFIVEEITLENLKKEMEGVDLSVNRNNIKKLEKENNNAKLGNLKFKTLCCES